MRRTYTPGLGFSGVGLYMGANTVEHGPHTAINGGGNDNLFEHNVVSHVTFECTDTGAFYVGRSWAQRGNVARYNSFDTIRPTEKLAQVSCSQVRKRAFSVYFRRLCCAVLSRPLPCSLTPRTLPPRPLSLHSPPPPAAPQNAFYLDDEMSGWEFYGNTIRNSTTGVLIGGGRRNVVRNNTFIDNDNDIHFDNRGMSWQHKSCLANCTLDPAINTTTTCLLHTLQQLDYTNPPYSTRYPELLTIFEDSPCVPVYTVIEDNRYCHTNSKGGGRFLDATDAQVKSWKSTSTNNTEDCS